MSDETDLASIGIKVDASQVTPAATQLGALTQAGAATEKQTLSLAVATKALSDAQRAGLPVTSAQIQAVGGWAAAQKILSAAIKETTAAQVASNATAATGVATFRTLQQGINLATGVTQTAIKSASASADAFKQSLEGLAAIEASGGLTATAAAAQRIAAVQASDKTISAFIQSLTGLKLVEEETAAATVVANNLATASTVESSAIQVAAHARTGRGVNGLSGSIRELFVLIREFARGDFSRMAGSLALEAQYTGFLAAAMTGVGLAISAVVVSLGAVAFAALKGAQEFSALNNLLKITGDYAGYTSGQIFELERNFAIANQTSIRGTVSAFNVLIGSGKLTGETLKTLGEDAILMSRLTGESADATAKDFLKMTDGVTKYAVNFNSQYHILTSAQIDYIRQLEIQGERERAEQVLSTDVYTGIRKVGVEQLGFLQAEWRDFGLTLDYIWDKLKSIGRDNTTLEKLALARAQFASDRAKWGDAVPGSIADNIYTRDLQNISNLGYQASIEEKLATTEANRVRTQQAGIDASARLNDEWMRFVKTADSADAAINRFHDDLAKALKANPNDTQALFDKAHMHEIETRIRRSFNPAEFRRIPNQDHWSDTIANNNNVRTSNTNGLNEIRDIRLENIRAGHASGLDAAHATLASDPDAYIKKQTAAYAEIDRLRKKDVLSEVQAIRAKAAVDAEVMKQRLSAADDFFGNLATLSDSKNKELAAIGKAAAIAQATIDGILAVQKALSAYPPPLNFIEAGAVGVAAAANVAKIAGFDRGGWTGNGSASDIAGAVHGQEFVVKAGPAAANRPMLEAMNSGRVGNGMPSIIVNNYGMPQIYSVENWNENEIRLIARDVVSKDTPKLMAQETKNKSSPFRRALSAHTQTQGKMTA